MAKMPGVKQRPLAPVMTQPRMLSHDIVCIHTMVGSLAGTESWFFRDGYTGTESHFGTGGDGEIRQWVDTAHSADANYQGSRRVISIENADHGAEFSKWNTSGDNVPPFTPAQIEANAQIIAWAHRTYGIPLRLISNTLPGQRGIGYHAQGVPGNGLVAGGVSWSTARGKVCPGRRRIAQIPQIITRAQQIVTGQTPVVPPSAQAAIQPVTRKDSTMIFKDGNSYTKDQPVLLGETTALRTGKWQVIRTVKPGEVFELPIDLRVSGLRAGQKAEAWVRLCEWDGQGNTTRFDYDRLTINGHADGDDVHVKFTQHDRVNMRPAGENTLRLYLIFKPLHGDAVVKRVNFKYFGD